MTESQETPAIKAENNGQYKTKNDKEGDGDVDAEPAHHARRPMNAFLIFCKRHRSVVRDKYPNLENRSITKILGEWWANLEKEEKASYTGLAKQYKDAFFDANPGFKWYKLPAPPLRTFATRPTNSETASLSGEPFPPDDICRPTKLEQTNNNHLTKLNYNVQPSTSKQLQGECKQMFTPGKLADEAQMGGISSLFLSDSPPRRCETDYDLLSRRLMPHSDTINPPGTPKSQLTTNATLMPNPPKKRPFCDDDDGVVGGTNFYRNSDISPPGGDMSHLREAKMQKLQDALSETTRSFAMSFQTSDDRSNASLKQPSLTKNNDHDNENINDFSNYIDRDKSKGNNTLYNSSATRSLTDTLDELTQQKIIDRVVNDNLSGEKYQSNVSSDESQDRESHLDDVHGFDPALSRSTGRACKGKRYKQFMAYGGLIVNKRQKKEHADCKTSLRNDMRNRLPYGVPATCTWKAYDADTTHRPSEPEDATDKLESNMPYYEQRDVPVSAYKCEADDTGQHTYYYEEHLEQGGETADNLGNKMFKASDFDLDAKIGALPSLSLDKFLLKKKENKKRKKNLTSSKHTDRPRYSSTVLTPYPLDRSKGQFFITPEQYDSSQKSFQPKPVADRLPYTKSQTMHQTITEDDRIRMAEQRKSAIIGSKKRKPRKHSITRLDVNSSTNLHHCSDKADIAKTTCTNVDKLHMKPTSNSLIQDQNSQNTEDLCALATLAEVAANTCKINEEA